MPKRRMTSCRSGACHTTACNAALCSVAEIGSAGADRVRIGSKSIEIIGGLRLSLVESFGRAIDRTLDRWVCLIDRQPAIDSDPHAARYIPPAWHPVRHVIPTRMCRVRPVHHSPPSIMIVAPREEPSTALTAAAVRRCMYHMMRVQARGMRSECCPTCDSLGAGNRWHQRCNVVRSYGCIRPNEGRVVSSIAAEKKPARWPRIDRNAARHSAWLLAPVAAACPNVSAMIGSIGAAQRHRRFRNARQRRALGSLAVDHAVGAVRGPCAEHAVPSQRLRVRNRGGSAHRSSALCQTAWRRRIARAGCAFGSCGGGRSVGQTRCRSADATDCP